MGITNNFNVVGYVHGDPVKYFTKAGKQGIRFTLIEEKNKYKIPLMVSESLVTRASFNCKNGNYVAVSGEIFSCEHNERGQICIKVLFIATEIMLLQKIPSKGVDVLDFSKLVTLYQPEDYNARKVRQKEIEDLEEEENDAEQSTHICTYDTKEEPQRNNN